MSNLNIKDYFEVALRSMIQSTSGVRRKVDGWVVFTVVGQEQGMWTFDLRADGTGDLVPEKVEQPDLHITMRDDFVPEFFSGRTDLERAMEQGRWGFRGKVRVGMALAELLQGGVSPLSARLGQGL